jgi:hypothetical protein
LSVGRLVPTDEPGRVEHILEVVALARRTPRFAPRSPRLAWGTCKSPFTRAMSPIEELRRFAEIAEKYYGCFLFLTKKRK